MSGPGASASLEDLIDKRQSVGNREYYAVRASQCFATATQPSWVDVCIDAPPTEPRLMSSLVENHTDIRSPLFPTDTVAPVAAGSVTKIESEIGFRQLLESQGGKCTNVIFIRQRNSASRLSICGSLFDTLCQQCDIFERVRDYVMCFGLRNGEAEITPPVMHSYINKVEHPKLIVSLECVYILRFVEPNGRQHGNPWSIRQFSVYNHLTTDRLPSTWLFIAISPSAERILNAWRDNQSSRTVHNPFELHYLLFDVAVASWRRYIVYLAEQIQHQADKAVLADLEADGATVTRLEERQYLKQLEDNVTDLISTLSFMLENIEAILDCYKRFLAQLSHIDPSVCVPIVQADAIIRGFEDRKRDISRFDSQAQALRRKVNSASNLVSNILDLSNGNVLKVLALESRTENANMALLTTKSVQDAAMVKVLTIITLVYLPVTVVTNFFSTQFIEPASTTDGTSNLSVRREVWILFALSVPLTAFTIYVWWMFAQREVRGRFPGDWQRVTGKLKLALQAARRSAGSTPVDSQ